MPALRSTSVRTTLAFLLASAGLIYASVTAMRFVYGSVPRHRAEAAWFIAAAVTLATFAFRSPRHAEPVVPGGPEGPPLQGPGSGGPPFPHLPALALFVCASLVLYLPAIGVGLLSDDFVLLERARSGSLTMSGGELFRPLPMLIWRVASPSGSPAPLLHGLNVIAHGVNGWLVFLIAIELGLSRRWGLVAGALFVGAASSVEPVTWVSALFDVLMATGALAYLVACLRGHGAVALVTLAVALLSKETGLAAALLGIAVCVIRRRSLRIPIAGLAVTATFVALRLYLFRPPDTYLSAPTRYVLKEIVSRAFGSIGLPWTASDIAAYPLLTAAPWLALVCLLMLALWHGLSRRALATVILCLSWVIVSVLPVYTFFFVAPNLEGSRYLYLGTAGFSLLMAELAFASSRTRGKTATIAALLAGSLVCTVVGVRLHQQPWLSAAAIRESVLDASAVTLTGTTCDAIAVGRLPDSTDGAFIFRNGFPEALRMRGIVTPPIGPEGSQSPECSYEWNGVRFEPANTRPVP